MTTTTLANLDTATDWLVRVYVPTFLDLAGLAEYAADLRAAQDTASAQAALRAAREASVAKLREEKRMANAMYDAQIGRGRKHRQPDYWFEAVEGDYGNRMVAAAQVAMDAVSAVESGTATAKRGLLCIARSVALDCAKIAAVRAVKVTDPRSPYVLARCAIQPTVEALRASALLSS